MKSLPRALDCITDETDPGTFELARDANQNPLFQVTRPEGWSAWSIPRAYREAADKLVMEAALLDKRLFKRLLPAYDAVAELDHIRSSLMRELQTQGDRVSDLDYASRALEDIYASIDALYRECA